MKIISTRPCLRSVQNLGPRVAFWGLIWVIFWSLFWVPFLGAVLVPWILFVIVGAQNGAQKWNPKQGPKYDPNQAPKCNPGLPISTETQTRTCRDDLHSAVGLLGDLILRNQTVQHGPFCLIHRASNIQCILHELSMTNMKSYKCKSMKCHPCAGAMHGHECSAKCFGLLLEDGEPSDPILTHFWHGCCANFYGNFPIWDYWHLVALW